MRQPDRSPVCRCVWLALAGLLALAPVARGEEPFQNFLDALREKHYFDSAMDYLDEMSRSPLASAEIKTLIPFEAARTLIEDARIERDVKQKQLKLEEAEKRLNDFVTRNSAHPLTPGARMQLGNVVIERGRMAIELANRPQNAPQKEKLLEPARELFNSALKVFDDAEANFNDKLKKFPNFIPPDQKALIEEREQARRDYIQAQLYAAATLYELSKTYAAKTKEQRDVLQKAADRYEKTYQAFRTRLAGLLARIKQGQCYQDMGDTRRALGLYADILGQPDDLIEFRKLKASALYLSLECWLADSEKKYELAHLKGDEWLAKARGLEDRQNDWLAIRYYTGLAKSLQAKELEKGSPQEQAQAKQLKTSALDHATRVAKMESPFQEVAKNLMRELGKADVDREPATFAEALDKGQVALDSMTAEQTSAKEAAAKGDVPARDEHQKAAIEHRDTAFKYLTLALSLRDSETPIDSVNNVRYYLCFMYFQQQRWYDAAVLGEFLARNYPSSAGARQGAKIALASYNYAYADKEMPEEFRQFDFDQMVSIAEYCQKRWPEEPETLDNWSILMAVAIGDHNLTRAVEFLERIPEMVPRRAESELKLGQAYWTEYLLGLQREESSRPPQAELDANMQGAQKWLESGMTRMKADVDMGNPPTIELIAAALSASQIYVGAGQVDKAIPLLEDSKIGPLALAENRDPLLYDSNSPIPLEAFKVGLRAYVGSASTNEKALERAEVMMQKLEALTSDGSGGAEQLTKIYISMGLALKEQIEQLRLANKLEELGKVTKGFELFLKKIAASEQGNSFASLNWVAETFYSLGAGYDTPGTTLPPEAKNYYDQSLATDEKILKLAATDKNFAPSADASVAINLRRARCLRRLARFKDSVDLLETILKERNQLLEAQIEAALAYMDWGVENPLYYNLAMFGARRPLGADNKPLPNAQNTIWGWTKMSGSLQADQRFQPQYHEARINMAKCHLEQALHPKAAENKLDKKQLLQAAYDDIRITTRFKDFAALQRSNKDIYDRYDDLLKKIQKARDPNGRPQGLKEFELPAAGVGTPAKNAAAAAS